MADPGVTMKAIQVSANLLFGKMIDSIAILFLLAGMGLIGFIAYWYLKVKRKK